MKRWTLACGLVIVLSAALSGQQPNPPRRAAAVLSGQQPAAPRVDPATLQGSVPIELVFLRDHGPVLVRVHVMHGDQPLQVRWQQYVERWFDYLDGKGRGALDDAALGGAPNAVSMRTLAAQGVFFPNRGQSLSVRDFGKTSDQTVTKAEFIDYYRKSGVGAVQTTLAPVDAAAAANSALFKMLDADGDGKLSRAEIEASKNLQAKLDVDDDELIAVRELAPGVVQTNVRGAVVAPPAQPLANPQLQGTSFFHLTSENARTGLATLLLARYDKKKRMTVTQKDIAMEDAAFKLLDENRNGTLDLIELAKLPQNMPAVELVVNLRSGTAAAPVAVVKEGLLPPQSFRMNAGTLAVALGDADIGVQYTDLGQGRIAFNQFAFILQQLKAADAKMRGYVELKDLDGPQQQFLRTLFPILDRDEDGKLTEKETQAYLDLQNAGRDVTASFFVQEQGRNWVQVFDANKDGQLSPRELLNAWQRLAVHDKNGDGMIGADELPMQFRIALNPAGNQQFFVAATGFAVDRAGPRGGMYPPQTPFWFRKMDRNGDGDISRREFLGMRADFDRIDKDGDGLLDPEEAAAVNQKK